MVDFLKKSYEIVIAICSLCCAICIAVLLSSGVVLLFLHSWWPSRFLLWNDKYSIFMYLGMMIFSSIFLFVRRCIEFTCVYFDTNRKMTQAVAAVSNGLALINSVVASNPQSSKDSLDGEKKS
jgi:hypothetical protein